MLIIRCSDDVDACELGTVIELARSYRMSVHLEDFFTIDDAATFYATRPQNFYDFVYLCGHGNETGFGGSGEDDDRDLDMPWPLLSWLICDTLRDESLVFLACCKAGMNTVAYDFFIGCDLLNRVFGPNVDSEGDSILLAFHYLIYDAIVKQNTDVDRAAACATMVTQNNSVLGYRRDDVVNEPAYQTYEQSGFADKYKKVLAAQGDEFIEKLENEFEGFVSACELDDRYVTPPV